MEKNPEILISEHFQQEQDQKLRKLLWENKVPVKIQIDSNDKALDQEEPFPLFRYISRINYIGVLFEEIHQFFERYCPVPLNIKNIWLECNQKPIPWNIPFGVFIDQLDQKQNKNSFSPYNITLHYRNYPIQLIPLEDNVEDQVRRTYKFSLKEASILRYGQREGCKNVLQDQNVQEWEEMWAGYKSLTSEKFFKNWDSKIWKIKQNEKAQVPIRIYMQELSFLQNFDYIFNSHIQNYTGRIEDAAVIKNENYTFGQYLCEIFPQIISQSEDQYKINDNYDQFQVISHGIEVDLNMPLLFFVRKFYYPDGFSYVYIKL